MVFIFSLSFYSFFCGESDLSYLHARLASDESERLLLTSIFCIIPSTGIPVVTIITSNLFNNTRYITMSSRSKTRILLSYHNTVQRTSVFNINNKNDLEWTVERLASIPRYQVYL